MRQHGSDTVVFASRPPSRLLNTLVLEPARAGAEAKTTLFGSPAAA
jgi:hypothetical protein